MNASAVPTPRRSANAARGNRERRSPLDRLCRRARSLTNFFRFQLDRRSNNCRAFDPIVRSEFEEEREIEAAGSAVIDILDASLIAHPCGLIRASNRFCCRSVASCSSRRASHSACSRERAFIQIAYVRLGVALDSFARASKVSLYLTLNCLRLVRRRVGQVLAAAVEKWRRSDVEN